MTVYVFGPESKAVFSVSDNLPRVFHLYLMKFILGYFNICKVVIVPVWKAVKGKVLKSPVNRAPAVSETHIVGYQAEYVRIIGHNANIKTFSVDNKLVFDESA